MTDARRLQMLAEEYWDGQLAASPSFATLIGDHRFDDQLERLDPDSLQGERDRLVATASAARSLEPESVQDRLTRDLLVHEATEQVTLLDLDIETAPVDPLRGVHAELQHTAAQVAAATPGQAEMLLARYARVPRLFREAEARIHERVEAGVTPAATSVTRVVGQLEGYLATDLDDDVFVGIDVPAEVADDWRGRMRVLVDETVRPAYAAHLAFVRGLLSSARDDDHAGLLHVPDGDARYTALAEVHTSLVVDPDVVHEIGVRDAEHELPEEWATIGASALGESALAPLFDRLRTDPTLRYDSPEAMVAHAEEVVARAWAAIDGWFDARPQAPCQVLPAPAALAPALPPAYYYPPAEDGSRPGTYFINTHDAHERPRFLYEGVAFHEAIPGHHFDRTLAQELTDVPAFRRYGLNTAHAEGWGLYTERLADEMGLYSAELDRLGMLTADAWRAGRLVVDTGIHVKGWTRQQALDWFDRWTPMGRDVVAQEVDRYIAMPGQALSYKMGQHHLFGLREEARRGLGDAFDIAAFHDAVLVRGGLPLPILTESVHQQLGLSG